MSTERLLEDIAEELRQITDELEAIIGRKSRWNGHVTIEAEGLFKGAKRYNCSIAISIQTAQHRTLRWRTLIHEALHALSPAYSRMQFDMYRGWEEGVVEKLQRLFRPIILERIGIQIAPEVFFAEEEHHPFNSYIAVLDDLQQQGGAEVEEFYILLLRTDLPKRAEQVEALGDKLIDPLASVKFHRSLLLAQAKLIRGPSYEA